MYMPAYTYKYGVKGNGCVNIGNFKLVICIRVFGTLKCYRVL